MSKSVREATEAKVTLAARIRGLIDDYETEHGLTVSSIEVDHETQYTGDSGIRVAKVEVHAVLW